LLLNLQALSMKKKEICRLIRESLKLNCTGTRQTTARA
jgi:hypothetical protein